MDPDEPSNASTGLVPIPRCIYGPRPQDFLQTTIVTIIVGYKAEEARHFLMDEALLKHYSTLFRAIITEGRLEPGPTIVLRLHDPEKFGIFQKWVTTDELFTSDAYTRTVPFTYTKIAQLYFYGRGLGAIQFCNAVVDVFCQKYASNREFPFSILPEVYRPNEEPLALRRCLVRLFVDDYRKELDLKKHEKKFTKDFLIDMIQLMAKEGLRLGEGLQKSSFEYIFHQRALICSRYHDHNF